MKFIATLLVATLLASPASAICRCFTEAGAERSCKDVPATFPVVCDKGDLDAIRDTIVESEARADKLQIDNADLTRKLEAAELTKQAIDKPCPAPESPIPGMVISGIVGVVLGVVAAAFLVLSGK